MVDQEMVKINKKDDHEIDACLVAIKNDDENKINKKETGTL